MPTLVVAAAALNQTPLDWRGNKTRIEHAIQRARDSGVQLLVLPELAVTGYGCEDMILAPHVHSRALGIALELSAKSSGLMLNLGIPVGHNGRLYNCNLICCNGQLLGLVAKKHLDGSGVHYEPRWFAEWPVGLQEQVEIDGFKLPAGDVIFALEGVTVGYEICHDAWVKDRHACALASRGVRLIANSSASHFAFGKHAVVRDLVQRGSALCQGAYIYSNLLGCEAGRTIYGGDRLIALNGTIIASGERFTFRDVEITTATIQLPAAPATPDAAAPSATRPVQAPRLITPPPTTLPRDIPTSGWEHERSFELRGELVSSLKVEEFARAVGLGLFDYLRKSHSKGFALSLSGGADSAATACLVKLMLEFALRDLGAGGLCSKLPHIQGLQDALSSNSAMQLILVTAYQATRNSSEITREAAKAVAQAVGAQFYDLDVDSLVRGYTNLIEDATKHSFAWSTDDLALQNIQSRVRSPSIWMLANLRGALLLSTGNRSEASAGYATMDGDTSGGLCPLGGIDKAFLRRWLLWLQSIGPIETGPIPELRLVTAQEPTAELRPITSKQLDEAELMPYDVLDHLERLAIHDRLPPLEVWKCSCEKFQGAYAAATLGQWVLRYFRLFALSQWKRERYAPAFHLDDLNLDPKSWCRFPILSGGFEEELAELQKVLSC